jgi:hypothetical protein
VTDVKMYNIGTGGNGGGMTGGACSPVVTVTLPVHLLERLGELHESLELLATRPASTPTINIEIPEATMPAPTFNVPAQAAPVVTVAPANVTVYVKIPARVGLYIAAIPAFYVAVGYIAVKYLGI